MSFAHTFTVTPPARADLQPWSTVRVEEAPAQTGPWTLIATAGLPLDATPGTPDQTTITVLTATLERGWFRFRFVDADANESPATDPVYSPVLLGAEYVPSVAQIAALLHTRTSVNGVYQGTFTADTYPTSAQVASIAQLAAADLALRLPAALPSTMHDEARHIAAYDAAATVEASYFTDEDSPVRALYNAKYLAGVQSLGGTVGTGSGTGAASTPPTFQQVTVRSGSYLAPDADLLP
jgi:hypothetical protein